MSELVVPLAILAVILVAGALTVALVLRSRRPRRPAPGPATAGPAPRRTRKAGADRGTELARPEQLGIRTLTDAERQTYVAAWRGVEERTEQAPALALSQADAVVERLLRECGYPVDDPRSPTDVLPGRHAAVLASFRAGQALEQVTTSSHVDLDQVRQGMAHYRSAFEAVVADGTPAFPDAPRVLSGEHARTPRTQPGR